MCTYVYVYMCTFTCTYMYIPEYQNLEMPLDNLCIYMFIHLYNCAFIYIYIPMLSYIYTSIHICIHV